MKLVGFFLSAFLLTLSLISHAQQAGNSLVLSYEKRLVLTYFIAGAGESETQQREWADRLGKTLVRYFQTPVRNVRVSQFQEFLMHYQGSWPNSYSVDSDLSLIERGSSRGPIQFQATQKDGTADPLLQGQISNFIRSQNLELLKKMSLRQVPVAGLFSLADEILASSNRFQLQSIIKKGFEQTNEILRKQLSLLENVGQEIASSGKLSSMDPTKRLFIESVLQLYFSRLSFKSKKQIVSSFLGQNLNLDSMKKFEILVMNSGPQFQKLLQVVAGDSNVSRDLQDTLKRLESDGRPIPPAIAKELIEAERDRYNWISYDLEKPKVGTMAQVHFGKARTAHGVEDVVIRFLKPEIRARVYEDARILVEMAKFMDGDPRFAEAGLPPLLPLVTDLNKTVSDELSLTDTIERQQMGRTVYNREILIKSPEYKTTLAINVPRVIDGGGGSQLMVQELVEGRKLEAETQPFEKVAPGMKKMIGEGLARAWLEEALFKSGFFHSDLHKGNFLVRVTDSTIYLHILDFGMGGVISRDLQTYLLLMEAGLQIHKPELVSKAILTLSLRDQNQVSDEELTRKVAQKMDRIRRGLIPAENFNDWIKWCMANGIRFPYAFVSLNRGLVILEQMLKEVNSSITVRDIALKLAIKNAKSLFLNMRSKGVLTVQDLVKLGFSAVTPAHSPKPDLPAALQNSLSARVRCEQVHARGQFKRNANFDLRTLGILGDES